ncbi:Inherit from bactNOG: outer membrane autotransporter barrel [Seminavis robusta]|uniref:Inherit from bactNOG: outer membrane autotransporter barrel n=1 Tax=Seminavis robusta TaxID=568900 RepID=A0A9N8DE47_9STRA|nr:Inherit from bactNOG: outer membrane autotransporter barrel [Seminavis robusta]|eukprot:Sro76_g041680.1 Inherit from bactNOG: outer membrane autotransporter barrel (1692) ;mRNA; f:75259-80894
MECFPDSPGEDSGGGARQLNKTGTQDNGEDENGVVMGKILTDEEQGHEVFADQEEEEDGENEGEKGLLSVESTTESTTGSTIGGTTSRKESEYSSVLWNGKVGTLVLEAEQIVFQGLSGIKVSIPWNLVKNHQWTTKDGTKNDNGTASSGAIESVGENDNDDNDERADARLCLLNGEHIDLQFAQKHSLRQIQQAVNQRLANSNLVNTYSEANKFIGVDGKIAAPIQAMATFSSSSTGCSENHTDEQQPLIPVLQENANLRASVNSLMSKVSDLQAQETTYRTRMELLELQFERFTSGILGSPKQQPSSPTTDSPPSVRFQQLEQQLAEPLPEDPLAQEIPVGNSDEAQTSDGDRRNDRRHSDAVFAVSESMATSEGMDLIRRKLRFRKSAVTGQSAYAKQLPPDTYGFLMVAPVRSAPYAMGFIVCLIQIVTFFLMAFSIINDGVVYENPIGIPPNIATQVRIVQFLAIIIAVVTQDDLMKALDLIRVVFSKSFYDAFPRTSKPKIVSCVVLRCLSGCLGLVASFFLIITSETIYYLLLNFTALEFISQLDEAFFVLSEYGYAGKTCEIAAKAMSATTFYVHTKVYRMRKTLLFFAILIALITGWSVIVHKQRSGSYQCKTLLVQFGDDMRPELATFSGLYDQRITKNKAHNGHLAYVDRKSKTGVFAYCTKGLYWTFQYHIDRVGTAVDIDPCKDWVARSASTTSYDILFSTASSWFVRDEADREVFFDPFVLVCHDCGDSYNSCSGRGTACNSAVCDCEDGYYGLQCEFKEPCQNVSMDSRFPGFVGTRPWSQSYELFVFNRQVVSVYNRPVYISKLEGNTFDLLFFTGRRWAVSYAGALAEVPEDDSVEALAIVADYMENHFHGHWDNYTVAFLSEAMDVLTPGDAQSPVELEWYVATERQPEQLIIQSPDLVQSVDGRLLCAVCDDVSNPCFYGGECKKGVCKCTLGSAGALCEKAPLGNGRCDSVVNTPLYDLDAGDCCASTCVSKQYTCGREKNGYGYIGYDCLLPNNVWEPRDTTAPLLRDAGQFGYSVALSKHGNFLVVGAPGLNLVKVFEREGSKWAQRGSPIEGQPDTRFGEHVTISSGPYNRWNNPDFKVPLIVGISAPDERNGTVHVYSCTDVSCSLSTRSFDGFDTFDIDEAGNVIALGETAHHDGYLPRVYIHEIDQLPSPRTSLGPRNTIIPAYAQRPIQVYGNGTSSLSHYIGSISLSRNSKTVAIQTAVMDWNVATNALLNCSSCFSFLTHSIEGSGNKSSVLLEDTVSIHTDSRSFVVSADSNVAAFATPSCEKPLARVYDWNGTAWTRRLGNLPKPPAEVCTKDFDRTPMSLSLSGTGATIAIGYSGRIEVYDYNGTRWNFVGKDEQGNLANKYGTTSRVSVSSSLDGSFVAYGIPGETSGQTGVAGVASTPPRFDRCHFKVEQQLHFSLTTDDYPDYLYWTLYNNNTGLLTDQANIGYYQDKKATYLHEMCVGLSTCSILTIYDEAALLGLGRGLQKPGRLDLLANSKDATGKAVRNNIDSGSFLGPMKRINIGNCTRCGKDTRFRMLMYTCEQVGWELVDRFGAVLVRGKSDEPLDPFNQYAPFFLDALQENLDLRNTTLMEENVTTLSPTAAPTAAPVGCVKKKYWEDLCLPLNSECFTFYAFLVQPKEGLSRSDATSVYLFEKSNEIWRQLITEEGQEAHSFGNCTR